MSPSSPKNIFCGSRAVFLSCFQQSIANVPSSLLIMTHPICRLQATDTLRTIYAGHGDSPDWPTTKCLI